MGKLFDNSDKFFNSLSKEEFNRMLEDYGFKYEDINNKPTTVQKTKERIYYYRKNPYKFICDYDNGAKLTLYQKIILYNYCLYLKIKSHLNNKLYKYLINKLYK